MSKQDLNVKKTVEFIREVYGDEKNAADVAVYTHCLSVAKLAEQIAQKLFSDIRPDLLPQDSQDIIVAIVHSSLLQHVINVGRKNFETIADVANVQIAAMVSTLSRDYRLVETKRDIEYRGRLSQSPLATQIVAVAGIICMAQEIVRFLDKHGLANLPRVRKILAQIDADLLVIHAASRYYTLRLYVHAARNLITDANQTIKKLKTVVRNAKQMERLTASVELKLAAKKGVPEEPANKKDLSRGKKRAAKRNSD